MKSICKVFSIIFLCALTNLSNAQTGNIFDKLNSVVSNVVQGIADNSQTQTTESPNQVPDYKGFRQTVKANLSNPDSKIVLYDFYSCLKTIDRKKMVFSSAEPNWSSKCSDLIRNGDHRFNRVFFNKDAQEVITLCDGYREQTNEGIAVPYTCGNSSCSRGCPAAFPEAVMSMKEEVLEQMQNDIINQKKAAQKNAQDKIAAEKTRVAEIRSKKYSLLPAKYRVETRSSIYGVAISVISTDESAFVIERIIINKRVGVANCDKDNVVAFMQLGDKHLEVFQGNCGNTLVKVDVYTNRGNLSFDIK